VALQQWPSAWSVLRGVGLVYLAWLGIQSLRRAAHPRTAAAPAAAGGMPRGAWQNVYEGFVTNLLNPAIATFYLVVLPQFIPRDAPIVRSALILTGIHIVLAASWHVTWAAAGGTLARMLAGGRPRQALEAISGVALIALAVKIALG